MYLLVSAPASMPCCSVLDVSTGLGSSAGGREAALSSLRAQPTQRRRDAIYGESLKKTWHWLSELGGDSQEVNMGIESPDGGSLTVSQRLKNLSAEDADKLRRLSAASPALLPAHLDALVQTSPKPHAEPDVTLFLHGPEEGSPEVLVVWRADLDAFDSQKLARDRRLVPTGFSGSDACPVGGTSALDDWNPGRFAPRRGFGGY